MVDTRKQGRRVQVPLFLAILVPLLGLLLGLYALALAYDRNPLPFPDRDYQVFSASSAEALVAMEDVMMSLGQRPRFRADSPNVQRTIFASGTIINQPEPRMLALLGSPPPRWDSSSTIRMPPRARSRSNCRPAASRPRPSTAPNRDCPSRSCAPMPWQAACWCSASTCCAWARNRMRGRRAGAEGRQRRSPRLRHFLLRLSAGSY